MIWSAWLRTSISSRFRLSSSAWPSASLRMRSTSTELGALDSGADRADLVRIDSLVAFLAENVLHQLLHARHAGHAADEHDFIDVARLVAGVLQGALNRPAAALDQVLDQLLELRPRD